MPEFLVLIYRDEAKMEGIDPQVAEQIVADFRDFGDHNGPSIRGSNALQPTSTATSVRKDAAGNFTVTDGAFAETKEALGGYVLLEAADLDAALKIAKQVPMPLGGGLEVRPIRTFD
jgi:hypothetical protein